MSQENVELVRSIYAAWELGDFGSAEWAHPDIEFEAADESMRWTGAAGMAAGVREGLSAFDEFHIEAEEYRELDDERVLVLCHFGGRGKASGLELEQMRTKGAHLFHVRDGKVTRIVFFMVRGHALADLGHLE